VLRVQALFPCYFLNILRSLGGLKKVKVEIPFIWSNFPLGK